MIGGWNVWKVYYATYAQVAAYGNRPAELVVRGLSLDAAKEMAANLGDGLSITDCGYGYCAKPNA
jgi:hypothetical protein